MNKTRKAYHRRLYKHLLLSGSILLSLSACAYPFAAAYPNKAFTTKSPDTWEPSKNELKKIEKVSLNKINYDLSEISEGSIGLGLIVDFTLKNNPNTQLYWAITQQKVAEFGLARADFYPTINVNTALNREKQSYFVSNSQLVDQYFSTWTAELDASYTILDFGARYANSEYAMQALFATAWAYNLELQTIIQLIASDYYNYLYDVANENAIQENVNDAEVSLEAAIKKLQSGIADVSDVLQAQTQLLQYQVNLVDAQVSMKNSFIKMLSDMGLPPTTNFDVAPFPKSLPTGKYLEGIDTFIDLAKSYNPNLASARADVLSKESLVKKAERDQWPVVKASFDITNTNYHENIPDTYVYTGSIQLSYPLFAGYWYRNKVREAKAELKQSLAKLKNAEDSIFQEVASYYNDYSYALERLKYTKAYLESAELDFLVNLSSYKAGTVDILNVLNAQSKLADARSKQINAVKDLFVSLTNLAFSTGSLINPPEGNTPYNFKLEDADSCID